MSRQGPGWAAYQGTVDDNPRMDSGAMVQRGPHRTGGIRRPQADRSRGSLPGPIARRSDRPSAAPRDDQDKKPDSDPGGRNRFPLSYGGLTSPHPLETKKRHGRRAGGRSSVWNARTTAPAGWRRSGRPVRFGAFGGQRGELRAIGAARWAATGWFEAEEGWAQRPTCSSRTTPAGGPRRLV